MRAGGDDKTQVAGPTSDSAPEETTAATTATTTQASQSSSFSLTEADWLTCEDIDTYATPLINSDQWTDHGGPYAIADTLTGKLGYRLDAGGLTPDFAVLVAKLNATIAIQKLGQFGSDPTWDIEQTQTTLFPAGKWCADHGAQPDGE